MIDFTGRLDGKAFEGGAAKDYALVLGNDTFIEDLENGLVGARAGATRNLAVTFPADYRHAPLAGQTVHFEVTVHEVTEPVLPEVNAEFAKLLGIADGERGTPARRDRANLEREACGRSRAPWCASRC